MKGCCAAAIETEASRTMSTDSKYEIIIFWSEEDDSFVAEVPELAGCMADGKSYEEVFPKAGRITKQWIETAKQLGRPIRRPGGRRPDRASCPRPRRVRPTF